MATCVVNRIQNAYVGPIGGVLNPTSGFASANGTVLFPEGDTAIATYYAPGPPFGSYAPTIYTSSTGGAWSRGEQLPYMGDATSTAAPQYAVGVPARAGAEHLAFLHTYGSLPDVLQLIESPSWSAVQQYSASDLGFVAIDDQALPPNLSSDGLRFVTFGALTTGESGIVYSDRATTSARFSPARLLVPLKVNSAFLSEDCARLYFSGVDATFYMELAP